VLQSRGARCSLMPHSFRISMAGSRVGADPGPRGSPRAAPPGLCGTTRFSAVAEILTKGKGLRTTAASETSRIASRAGVHHAAGTIAATSSLLRAENWRCPALPPHSAPGAGRVRCATATRSCRECHSSGFGSGGSCWPKTRFLSGWPASHCRSAHRRSAHIRRTCSRPERRRPVSARWSSSGIHRPGRRG